MGRLRTIQSIYEDFLKRREGLINALTDGMFLMNHWFPWVQLKLKTSVVHMIADSEDFFKACDPNRDNLCLYGNSNGSWDVDLPAAEVPPELPEPVLGINFARDGMEKKDWLALCAVHSDAWLMSVIFFYAARFDDTGRAELFALVNQHPTVYEVATGRVSRNKMFKQRQLTSGRSPGTGVMYGNGGGATPMEPQQQFYFQGPVSSTTPAASGRLLVESDVTPALRGRQAELYWPDDGKWYLVAIQALDLRTTKAKVQYATGEEETLDLAEVIRERQMNLLL